MEIGKPITHADLYGLRQEIWSKWAKKRAQELFDKYRKKFDAEESKTHKLELITDDLRSMDMPLKRYEMYAIQRKINEIVDVINELKKKED